MFGKNNGQVSSKLDTNSKPTDPSSMNSKQKTWGKLYQGILQWHCLKLVIKMKLLKQPEVNAHPYWKTRKGKYVGQCLKAIQEVQYKPDGWALTFF